MDTIISIAELRTLRGKWREQNASVAFVPTMGALHEGHLSLIGAARERAKKVIASIFVNPKQFGPSEDFARYPRTLEADLEKLTTGGADAVFLPNAADIYPSGFQTYVHNTVIASGLCGVSRPGHFDGVLTVVMKLFNLVEPDIALFGKKDYQQFRLIETMVRDLCLNLKIEGCETMREADGLAMSSRNRYLTAEEREQAVGIFQGMMLVKGAFDKGERKTTVLLEKFCEHLAKFPKFQLEYVDLRRQDDLAEVGDEAPAKGVVLVAARMGNTRLIDNLELG